MAAETRPEAPEDTAVAVDAAPAKERGPLHYVGLGLSVLLLLSMFAMAAILIVIPKVGGAIPLTVLTQSMEPTLPPGTLIMVRPVAMDDVRVGDVITYQIRSGEPDVITHRVIGKGSSADGTNTLILQGDNNASPDPDPVIPAQVQGKLWYSVPYVGYVNSIVNGENRSWIVAVVAGLFFAYALYMIVAAVLDRRKKVAAARSTPTDR